MRRVEGQGELPLGDEWLLRPKRPKKPERLFFAIMIGNLVGEEVWRFSRGFTGDMGLGGSLLPAWRLHITLHFIGDYPRLRSKLLYAVRQAARMVRLGPIEIGFRFVTSFEPPPGREHRQALVLLAESDALLRLVHDLGIAMRANGLKAELDGTMHATIGYFDASVPLQAIKPFGLIAPTFGLIHNARGLGRRYEMLDEWRLAA